MTRDEVARKLNAMRENSRYLDQRDVVSMLTNFVNGQCYRAISQSP
jgi:hypothetical protein